MNRLFHCFPRSAAAASAVIRRSLFDVRRLAFICSARCARPQRVSCPPAAGFTLVEAVLALAILSIGLFALMEATGKCLAVIRQSQNYQTARAVLDRGELEHPLRRTNDVERNAVSETYDGYTFSREVQAVEGEKGLYLVITRVSGAQPDQPPIEEVVSCLYSPEAVLTGGTP